MRRSQVIVGYSSLIALVAIASACGAFDSVPDDAPATPDVDASTSDATSADSSFDLDSTTPDPNDSSSDASVDAFDAGNPCATQHLLCDRFDRDAAMGAPWNAIASGNGGVTITAVSGSPSPPNVLTAQTTGLATAQLGATFLSSAQGIRCDVDLRIETRGMAEAILFGLGVANTPDSYYYRVEMRGSALSDSFLRYGTVKGIDLPSSNTNAMLASAWHHLTFELSMGATRFVRVFIDGNKVVDDLGLDASATMPAAEESLVIGAQSLTNDSQWKVHFDDVVCDLIQ